MQLVRLATLAAALLAPSASAQILLNEVYASHQGVDDLEYVEVVGPAGTDLTGWVVGLAYGDVAVMGRLYRAWDLSGFTLPDDGGGLGYFVVGCNGVTNVDLAAGLDNVIGNVTTIVYLARVPDPAAVAALAGQYQDFNDNFRIDAFENAFELDVVALVDGGFPTGGDRLFDGAMPIGPAANGLTAPAGIFREPDGGPWCTDTYLDFDDVSNHNQPRTPGAANVAMCQAAEPGLAFCFGVSCPCGNVDASAGCANSTGSGALLSGSGSRSVALDDLVLTASGVPAFQQGLFYMGDFAMSAPLADGLQCALGVTLRFQGDVQSSGASGTMTLASPAAKSFGRIQPGTTWYFHAWHRDVPGSPCGTGSNLTNVYAVSFVP